MIPLDQITEHNFPISTNTESNDLSYLFALIPISLLLIAAIYIYTNKSATNEI